MNSWLSTLSVAAGEEGQMDQDRSDDLTDTSQESDPAEAQAETPSGTRKIRHKRRERARSKTIAPKRLTKEELRFRDLLPLFADPDRPRTRGQCKEDVRPCPYVSCKHHLY